MVVVVDGASGATYFSKATTQFVAMAACAVARVTWPEQTRLLNLFSNTSFVLEVDVAFGLSLGSTHRLAGSFGSPPSSKEIKWSYSAVWKEPL